MISIWFLIPAVFIGVIFGVTITGIYAASQDDSLNHKRKWWEDE